MALASLVILCACASRPALGSSCSSAASCPIPLVCRLGVCRETCVLNGDCPLGARCLVDRDGFGGCSLTVDMCTAGTCATSLVCEHQVCSTVCDPAAPNCPADARCIPISMTTRGYCDESRMSVDAGGSEDAAVDARPADAR